MKRILICGDRNWSDQRSIEAFVNLLPRDAVVIEGGAPGADTLAGLCAITAGLSLLVYPADWRRYGRAAGPIRNAQMLDEGQPTEVHYFHDSIATSRGTANMVRQAQKRGIPVFGHTSFGKE